MSKYKYIKGIGKVEDDKQTMLSENERGHYLVRYDMGFGGETTVQIEEHCVIARETFTWVVDLPPWEALALLAWLTREKANLERRGKEQKENDEDE